MLSKISIIGNEKGRVVAEFNCNKSFIVNGIIKLCDELDDMQLKLMLMMIADQRIFTSNEVDELNIGYALDMITHGEYTKNRERNMNK